MIQKLSSRDYAVSAWSGGTTTQLAIFPPEAKYADRDFLWRVSSASVELEDSDFTPLPDYERLIAALEGEIVLTHDGGAPLRLRPFEVHAFSGASATHSRGRCIDFNLMLRRGRAQGAMTALRLERDPAAVSGGAGETMLLYCAAGQLLVCTPSAPAARDCHPERSAAKPKEPPADFSLVPGETLLLTGEGVLTLTGPATIMLCRMRL